METIIVDPRKTTPEEMERGMRDVKLVFTINHTMPYTEDYNKSSQHLCEKLGMRQEGLFKEFISFVKNHDGTPHYENTYQYAILKKEWDTK